MPPHDIQKINSWFVSQLEKSAANVGFMMAEGGAQLTPEGNMPKTEIAKGGHLLTGPDLELLEETLTGAPETLPDELRKSKAKRVRRKDIYRHTIFGRKSISEILGRGVFGESGVARPHIAEVRDIFEEGTRRQGTRAGQKFFRGDILNLLENRPDVLDSIEELTVDLRGNRDGTPSNSTMKTARKNYHGVLAFDEDTTKKYIRYSKRKRGGIGFTKKIPKDLDRFLGNILQQISKREGYELTRFIDAKIAEEAGEISKSISGMVSSQDKDFARKSLSSTRWATIKDNLERLKENIYRLRDPKTTIPPKFLSEPHNFKWSMFKSKQWNEKRLNQFYADPEEWNPIKEVEGYAKEKKIPYTPKGDVISPRVPKFEKLIKGRPNWRRVELKEDVVRGQKLPYKFMAYSDDFNKRLQTSEKALGEVTEFAGNEIKSMEDTLRLPEELDSRTATQHRVTTAEATEYRKLAKEAGITSGLKQGEIIEAIRKDPYGWRDSFFQSEKPRGTWSLGGTAVSHKPKELIDPKKMDSLWKKYDLDPVKVKASIKGGADSLTKAEKNRLTKLSAEVKRLLKLSGEPLLRYPLNVADDLPAHVLHRDPKYLSEFASEKTAPWFTPSEKKKGFPSHKIKNIIDPRFFAPDARGGKPTKAKGKYSSRIDRLLDLPIRTDAHTLRSPRGGVKLKGKLGMAQMIATGLYGMINKGT